MFQIDLEPTPNPPAIALPDGALSFSSLMVIYKRSSWVKL